jgi:hypothetical protein
MIILQFEGDDGCHVDKLWTSLDYLTEGHNVLVVRLIRSGGIQTLIDSPCTLTILAIVTLTSQLTNTL